MKKLMLIIMLVVLSISCYASNPDFQQESNGININYKNQIFIKQNQNYGFHVHAFNDSVGGGILTNTTTSCTIHLYNQSGNHIIQNSGTMSYSNADFSINILGDNFSTTGHYVWTVGCSNNDGWGYVSGYLKVTPDGLDDTPDTVSALGVLFFMLFIIIGLFFLGFVGNFNKFDIVNLCIRRGCFVTAIMLSMYTATLLLSVMSYANLYILSREMIFLITWIGWAGYMASVYLVIKTLFDILELRKKQKEGKVYAEVK